MWFGKYAHYVNSSNMFDIGKKAEKKFHYNVFISKRLKLLCCMPNQSCCVGSCNDKSWLPNEPVVREHVKKLVFHSFPKDEA